MMCLVNKSSLTNYIYSQYGIEKDLLYAKGFIKQES